MIMEALLVGVALGLAATLRYFLMVGIYYGVVYVFFKEKLHQFKIDPDFPEAKMIKEEMYWGVVNNINFFILGVMLYFLYQNGMLKIYTDINEYGWFYAIAIIPVLLFIHDAYFFWSHYLMHRPWFRKYSHHHIHHQFHNVSPWAAFSVHPVEGFIEVMVRPLILMLIPLHPYTIGVFAIITFTLNIIGHSGYEFFPKNYATSEFTKVKSCATFHHQHHQNGNYNFGLFLNIWDRMMGTLHPDYEKAFEKSSKANPFKIPMNFRSGLESFRGLFKIFRF